MKFKELSSMSDKELMEKMNEFGKELMKERTQISTGTQLKNPGKVKLLRKDIARIKLILHTREGNKNKDNTNKDNTKKDNKHKDNKTMDNKNKEVKKE